MAQGGQFQLAYLLHVFQQLALFLHFFFAAALDVLGPFHQGSAAGTHIAPIQGRHLTLRHMKLAFFRIGTECRRPPCALAQPGDIPAQGFVLGGFTLVLQVESGFPRVVVALHHGDLGPLHGHHMVNAAVEEGTVVAHQQKTILAAQIIGHLLAAMEIQMVGGLVNERVHIIPGEKGAQQRLGLLAVAQCAEGTLQRLLAAKELVPLAQEAPILGIRRSGAHHFHGGQAGISDRIGEIHRWQRHMHLAAAVQLSAEQAQKRGLAPAVSSCQAQPPGGIQPGGQAFKHGVRAAIVGIGQILNGNVHLGSLLGKKPREWQNKNSLHPWAAVSSQQKNEAHRCASSPAMASQIHRPKIPAVILCLRSPDQFGAAGLFAHLSNSVSGLIWLFT